MESLQKSLREYGKLLQETDMQRAYRGLMKYILGLQQHFKEQHPKYEVSSNFYQGYLDLTFFSFTTELMKQRKLKYMVVFNHERMRFEGWLSGRNRAVMSEYHHKFSRFPMDQYQLTTDEKGMAAIVVAVVVETPDFDDPIHLTDQIEKGIIRFVKDMEHTLLKIS